MKKFEIHNLRGIEHLDFPLPERPGAYLLTGANGAGKSTVLSCLALLGDVHALDFFFAPGIRFVDSDAGDSFSGSVIRYECDSFAADFRFSGDRWISDVPAAAERTAETFGFSKTVYTGAKAKHIPLPGEQFSVKDVRRVSEDVACTVSSVFDDDKFMHLHSIRANGNGEEIFLIRVADGSRVSFFSENSFSAGERAVLFLVSTLESLPRGSLILIDESAMALHPKAQKHLMDYLSDQARRFSHTILVSTQSASLIRITDPRNILFLENDGFGKMVCRTNVYPAAVLGEMAISEEILPERVLLVEDSEAAMLLEAIVEKLKSVVPDEFPYCKILPVGGYMQVVILLDNLERVFPPYVKRRAVLDKDAERQIRQTAAEPWRPHGDIVRRNIQRIYFLPCAPEQGVVRLLESACDPGFRKLAKLFGDRRPPLDEVMNSERYRSVPGDSRSDCKDKLSMIAHALSRFSGEPEPYIRKKLYRFYADNRYTDMRELKEDYCSLIFRT